MHGSNKICEICFFLNDKLKSEDIREKMRNKICNLFRGRDEKLSGKNGLQHAKLFNPLLLEQILIITLTADLQLPDMKRATNVELIFKTTEEHTPPTYLLQLIWKKKYVGL